MAILNVGTPVIVQKAEGDCHVCTARRAKLVGEIIETKIVENDWCEVDDDAPAFIKRCRVMPTNTGTYFMDEYNVCDWQPGEPLWFDLSELATI